LDEIKIIVTGDGSHSLVNEALNETYHSRHGAVRESMHVFIEHGLQFFANKQPKNSISILEVGFGTGLNALLTINEAKRRNLTVQYTSLETFPILETIWRTLNYPDAYNFFKQLHSAAWNRWVEITPYFSLQKREMSLQKVNLKTIEYDVIFFDAFAPNKQPELWQLPMLEKVCASIKPNGLFVTYCAKGQLKRDLKSLGLIVESLPGPPGKREMVRAVKP
jgi:tRNA U34 5-methylaminomethyl-2-thiouridine-forming methyltransferase MnmC